MPVWLLDDEDDPRARLQDCDGMRLGATAVELRDTGPRFFYKTNRFSKFHYFFPVQKMCEKVKGLFHISYLTPE